MSVHDATVASGPVRKGRAALARGLALAVTALLTLVPVGVAAPLSAAAAANDVGGATTALTVEPAGVVIDQISPMTAAPSDTVTVRATVRNTGTESLDAARATLSIVRYRLQSRTQLRAWFADELALPAAARLTAVDLDDPLAPGEARTVDLSVPAADLHLLPYPEASGPRGIVVELEDGAAGTVASARSFLQWFPEGAPKATRLSILVPVTGPAATPSAPDAWNERMAGAVAPSGRLARILAATAASRDVSWVVDPALVDTAAAGVGDAGAWASGLMSASAGREVFTVDRFDPDVATLAAAGVQPFLRGAAATSDATVRGWRSDLSLPVPGTASKEVLESAAAAGDSLVVVDGGLESVGAATVSGVVPVGTAAGTVRALVPDAELGALLSDATATNQQLLLAELAVAAQEQPGRSPHVLIVTGRDWDPDPEATSNLLASLDAAPFVNLQPVATLAGAQPEEAAWRDLVPAAAPGSGLTPRQLGTAAAQRSAVASLAAVVPDPDALTATYTRDLAASTSVAAAEVPGLARDVLEGALAQGESLLGALTVLPGSTVNLINESGSIPVTVRNDLPQVATVTVALRPQESRLSVEDVREATIEPGATADVQVPVRAIGSGDVRVKVEIIGADGRVIAPPSEFTVRVRAGWETVGTAVIGGLLVVLLVGGIIRTVRRGRSAHRMEPIRPMEADDEVGGR